MRYAESDIQSLIERQSLPLAVSDLLEAADQIIYSEISDICGREYAWPGTPTFNSECATGGIIALNFNELNHEALLTVIGNSDSSLADNEFVDIRLQDSLEMAAWLASKIDIVSERPGVLTINIGENYLRSLEAEAIANSNDADYLPGVKISIHKSGQVVARVLRSLYFAGNHYPEASDTVKSFYSGLGLDQMTAEPLIRGQKYILEEVHIKKLAYFLRNIVGQRIIPGETTPNNLRITSLFIELTPK